MTSQILSQRRDGDFEPDVPALAEIVGHRLRRTRDLHLNPLDGSSYPGSGESYRL
jgi:hypothetical protein